MMVAYYSRISRLVRDRPMYAFCVFIDAAAQEVEQLAEVEYVLHPTFPNPIRRVIEPSHRFAMESEAWGSFGITARLVHRDGRESTERLFVELRDAKWPMGPIGPGDGADRDVSRVYETLLEPKFEWRKISTVARRLAKTETEVEALLITLARGSYARRAPFPALDGDALWGATSRIGILPDLKTG